MIVVEKLNDSSWVKIEDHSLARLILVTLGDSDNKSILDAVLDQSRIISDILEICKIPQTSGYRKIKSMIENDILITDGFINTPDGKKVNRYRSIFQNVRIGIKKNSVIVEIKITRELLERLDKLSKFEYVRLKLSLQENYLERGMQ